MTTYRCSKFITHNGIDHDVGQLIELTDDDVIARLEDKRAIESLDIPKKEVVDIVDQLCKVDGVNKSLAKDLIKQGIKTIDQLGVMQVEELEKFKGVSKKTAEKIYGAFAEIK